MKEPTLHFLILIAVVAALILATSGCAAVQEIRYLNDFEQLKAQHLSSGVFGQNPSGEGAFRTASDSAGILKRN